MTLIQSHNYTINLANVNYIRAHIDSPSMRNMTMFKMNNGKTVVITCPYDEVIRQLQDGINCMNGDMKGLVILYYDEDEVLVKHCNV